ncbi:uroporphyrinogen decarboxylase [Gordonia oryzae]|uniref:Uroporphyrinogen decarboxylase n=1 Tax=Gordonia oryzae TaxID=2487349 RepID=A0A3N4HG87_9ACTN|nr:uroporphyrinogen decarboxylase [Gordonia oryzae]RPA66104.1 uroporphyrinogen decarboxylase [Gordonia oryzae]
MSHAPGTRRNHSRMPLVAAARGQSPARRPVWFMRQAGRSLPEYRAIRAEIGMLESCFDADLVCEITLQPVRRHDVDAAILFSDIVVPLKAAGVDLDIVAGTGPVIAAPIRSTADVEALPRLDPSAVGAVARAVTKILDQLDEATALIGFAGAPFTLASYLIEGGPSRNYVHTKALMRSDPDTWHALMARLADITITFLQVQLDAGVDAVQVFDSWAGALSEADYRTLVAPHVDRVFAELAEYGVPRIHFGVGTGELLAAMAEPADVIGVDWRVPLEEAVHRVGPGKAVQGNLDPTVLFAGPAVVEQEIRRVLDDGRRAVAAGATGHIVNLGHGVLPDTDPDVLTRAVELIHTL